MSENVPNTECVLLNLSRRLLDAIDQKDWKTYTSLCDENLTAFEGESNGHLIEGLPFHKFYFDLPTRGARQSTISSPNVRLYETTAIVTYIRLVQFTDSEQSPIERTFSETRVWVSRDGTWKHVHFHRSDA